MRVNNVLEHLFPAARKIAATVIPNPEHQRRARLAKQYIFGESESTAGETIGPPMKLALVVGHNQVRQGAVCVGENPVPEFLFNTGVAQEIAFAAWVGLEVRTFFRKPHPSFREEICEVYRRVNAWMPTLTLELHFNAHDGTADSTRMFTIRDSDLPMADLLAAGVSHVLQTSSWSTSVLSSSARGAWSGKQCRSPWILAEPFFGDHPETMNRLNASGAVTRVADAYMEGLQRVGTRRVPGGSSL